MRIIVLDKFKNSSEYIDVCSFKIKKHKLFIYFYEHRFLNFINFVSFNLSYVVKFEIFSY